MDPTTALEVARAFKDDTEQMFFLYRDTIAALRAYHQTYAGIDRGTFMEYRVGDHAVAPSTVGEFRDRSARDGPHEARLANLALVTLYEIWEHRRRDELAAALSLVREEVKISALGDLRLFRNAILHPAGEARADLAKCEIMRWFQPGDPVRFGPPEVEEICGRVGSGIDEFVVTRLRTAT